MKVSKVALSSGRRLFRMCQEHGVLNEEKFRSVIKALGEQKPRDYRAILKVLKRLYLADAHQKEVTVTSAEALTPEETQRVENQLRERYGDGLSISYQVEPSLLGGLKIQVGHDVFDSSIKSRLNRLEAAL